MSNGILPLSGKTLQRLGLKHPEAKQAHNETMLQDPKRHSIFYEDTNQDLVKKEAIKTKGGSGLLGLDADN